jgi:GWxTD domain-containing protein
MASVMRGLLLLGFVLIGAFPPGLGAQTVDDVRRLAAAGDTTAALTAVEAVLKRDRRDAEAHWVAGQLYLSRHVPGNRVSRPRRMAEEHLRYATRFGPDSVKYWLTLADLFRSENLVTLRVQVPGLIENAAKALTVSATDSLTAEVGFRVARLEWERHEHFGRRYAPLEAGAPLSIPGTFAEWKYWEGFFERGVREVPVSGEHLINAEGALWQVLRANPADVAATGLLVVLMGETYRWEETVPLTLRLVRAVPDSGRAWALFGLACARAGRWHDATAAFDSAFRRMAPHELAPYRDLGRIMRRAERLRWDTAPDAARSRLDSLFWQVAQPLAITDRNEMQAEFYARLTYVEHRWSDPWLRYRGHETDIGSVYAAYGPPDLWMVFNRQLITWVYRPSHYRFQFSLTPGYSRARFGAESREALRVAQEERPARFDNVPLLRTLDTVLVQVAQFRDAGDTTAVVIFGAIPLARIVEAASPIAGLEFTSGAVVTDSLGRELQRDRRSEFVREAGPDGVVHRSWRLRLAPGPYLLRAEAHLPALDRGARGMEPLAVRAYPPGPLALSDILAAARLQPRDSLARRWRDFFVEPNGGRFLPGDSLALLWEIYDLATDTNGVAHFDVQLRITIEAIERRSFVAQIIGGLGDAMGVTAQGDDRVSLDYDRQVTVGADGATAEFVTVELRDAPEGRYTVGVTIRDRATGAVATRERVITVSRDPPARRTTYTTFW